MALAYKNKTVIYWRTWKFSIVYSQPKDYKIGERGNMTLAEKNVMNALMIATKRGLTLEDILENIDRIKNDLNWTDEQTLFAKKEITTI